MGTIATYSCSPGYQLVKGSSLKVCGPNGTWNGTQPLCQGKPHKQIQGKIEARMGIRVMPDETYCTIIINCLVHHVHMLVRWCSSQSNYHNLSNSPHNGRGALPS